MKILGCGDLFISRDLPEKPYAGFKEVADIIHEYDVKFGNLETTVHDNEGYPACFPGGGWAMAPTSVLKSVKSYGFNVVSIANNHSMDYSHKGLEATMNHLQENGLTYVGAGMNLAEASLPKYVECAEGRVAFIATTSSFHDSDAAGPAGGVIQGRPGVNPLRHTEVYQVTPELYEALETVAAATGINDMYSWSMKNGYMERGSALQLLGLKFSKGDVSKKISHPLKKDLERTQRGIKEARMNADCVVLSIHNHQMSGDDETPDTFIVEYCHECIDAGADIIFCHGSHILRGIEIYGKGVIFYGLGDFILQNETVPALPREFYEKYNIAFEDYDLIGSGMNVRSNNETRGLVSNPLAWQSIMAGVELNSWGGR